MNDLSNLQIDEISILTKKTRPAVAGALVRLAKSDTVSGIEAIAKAEADFNGIVETIMKRDSVTRSIAMTKAANERPDSIRAYQDEANPAAAAIRKQKVAIGAANGAIDAAMEKLIAGQMKAGETKAQAWRRIMEENPDLYARHQELLSASQGAA